MDRHRLALLIFVERATHPVDHPTTADQPADAYRLADLFLAEEARQEAAEEAGPKPK